MDIRKPLLLCAITMLMVSSVLIAATPAYGWPPTGSYLKGKITAGGWYVTGDGDRASFGLEAGKLFQVVGLPDFVPGDFSGHGSFMDNQFRLKAILTMTGGSVVPDYQGPGTFWVGLFGTARIYVDNSFVGEMSFQAAFVVHASPGDRTDTARFIFPDLSYDSSGVLVGGNADFHV
jgi:hypothetical protein